MPLALVNGDVRSWSVEKIGVVGPGIVGVPMATLLAHAPLEGGVRGRPHVVVVQRPSPSSGWKVNAINAGRSPIGGVEPELGRLVAEAVAAGRLSATHDYAGLTDADVILVCVQTDRDGNAPAYGPLMESLAGVARALQQKPEGNVPLVVIESTLAPSSMSTVIREFFAAHGLEDGRDVLLGNSPNRVMPGRLAERVTNSDKLVAGLLPTTARLIEHLYGSIVRNGTLHRTNSLTAEVVKTLENAYRDVRIAYSTEVVRFCDAHDVSFYRARDEVNARLARSDDASTDPNAVPSGGLLIPTLGVGGHCLPKDGILLWWRRLERGDDGRHSLILEARRINDEAPAGALEMLELRWGPLEGKSLALLGAAYRFNSEDTRNSPTLALANLLESRGIPFTIHDPYVKPDDQNLRRFGLEGRFTRDLDAALDGAQLVVLCTAHRDYMSVADRLTGVPGLRGVFDACNLLPREESRVGLDYWGIGRGTKAPRPQLVEEIYDGFRAVERGVANEVRTLIDFLNESYARTSFERIDFSEVQRLAATCGTGCAIVEPGPVEVVAGTSGFASRLVRSALGD